MIKYCYTYQSYFCHFGASETVHMFDTKDEAERAMSEDFRLNEDAYVSSVYKKVVLTEAEKKLREARAKANQPVKTFDYKVDSEAYGIITFWDGTKDAFFIVGNRIYFLVSKESYPLYQWIDDEDKSIDCALKFIKDNRRSPSYLPF